MPCPLAGLLLCAASLVIACDQPHELILASTTSTVDSGLLDVLIPAFERAHDETRVTVIAVGSGEAMALGRRGDADILLVHSPAEEEAFMAAGHGSHRSPVMANDFIIAGPPEDPAGVLGERDVGEALRRIAATGSSFISRGDGSGTHRKELDLWRAAGVTHDTRTEVGQGMGESLTIASERGSYILTDRGTWLALASNLNLDVLVEGDAQLANPYSIIRVNGSRNARDAELFADWIVSPAAAELIRTFEQFGEQLFFPAADSLRA
jgi:tungstate transport system substrate-binding protein